MRYYDHVKWWLYIFVGVVFLFFVLPSMMSAPDTLTNIAAIMLLVLFGVWSWHLWIKKVLKSLEGKF